MDRLLLGDLRFALRWLRRSPGFAAVAVASLGIGIAFNATLFAVDRLDPAAAAPRAGARTSR